MTAILHDFPFFQEATEVSMGLERLPIKAYQIIVWVSLTGRNVVELPPHASRLPAILDIGHNHNFAIQQRHLADGARLDVQTLGQIGAIRERGRRLPSLPLLGLRALVRNQLHFTLDPLRHVIHLRTQDWRTRLLRWLM
jgi:hypothetical protein